MIHAHEAIRIFTGEEWLMNRAILVENGIIHDIVPNNEIPPGAIITNYVSGFLAPGFIDIQIYGAEGSLLAVDPTPLSLQKTYEYCKAGGAPYYQPTVATNSYDVFYKCIDAVKEYWHNGGKGVIGLHVEGPWINKAKKGAHAEQYIHSPTVEQAKALLEYGKGAITMITLAPEVCSTDVIELIQSYGVVISAGHSNATFEEANEGFLKGINAATHLYNAMSPLQHRAPGIVGAVLNHERVMASIVADGFHVDFPAINIAKKIMQDRLFFITDAVTETSDGYYPHKLVGDKYESNGVLSGSALTMGMCVRNAVEEVGIELSEALRMAGLYPAQVMKLDKQLGRIARGYKASFVVMNDNLEVLQAVD
ncbi:N-acetylglucosamine-6-phosphate deacetylase [Segetibacter sp.]|jgi:N-acetylglucosamine-6-phosphate deacetylase|uniref:N-acetylglucosamine-6-phosphate deacetylase n=1 Tax=Segetibacter sp. TaxID=2231182 RepID=UPI0026275E13|nr:N-acetylglucosamine-6-phosphate deacetylase [Segetibacter sp.]MCW3082177.1 N-acetylglucosamine-6-phosphate deacetylase [Segetibacter sp.]